MIRSKSTGYKVFTVFNYVLLILIGFLCLAPMLHTIFASFSEPGPLSAHIGFIFRPLGFTLNGYKLVFQNPNIYTGYVNTIIYVICSTLLGTALTITSGFVLSRKNLLLKNQMMFFLAFTMMFNGGMIPFYMVVRNLGMLDTRWALIIPGCVNVFNIIIMRTSMAEIPDSLEEAARIDGAGSMTIMTRIVVPLSKATIAVVVLFYAVGQWNAWFNASIFLQDRSLYPLQLILRDILIQNDASQMNRSDLENNLAIYKDLIKYCTTVIATLPILCVYPFVQKYFVKGVMIGSVKG
ncbi:carbohydrate ABC transporter permease [Eisenbergiella sp.]